MKKDILTYSFLALREKLHRSAMGVLRDDEDARDALQDTFLRLWRVGNVESDAEARNKLFAVLRNLCIDRLRRPRSMRLPEGMEESMAVETEPPEDMERLERLLSADLSDTQRKVYACVVNEGMEYEDAARMLGMTVEAVRMQMSRARRKIRENYKKLNR